MFVSFPALNEINIFANARAFSQLFVQKFRQGQHVLLFLLATKICTTESDASLSSAPSINISAMWAPSLKYLFKCSRERSIFFCFSLPRKSTPPQGMFVSSSALDQKSVASVRRRGFLKHHYVKCLDMFQTKHLVKHDPVLIFLFFFWHQKTVLNAAYSPLPLSPKQVDTYLMCVSFFCLEGEKDPCDVSPGLCKYHPFRYLKTFQKPRRWWPHIRLYLFSDFKILWAWIAWSSLPLSPKDTPVWSMWAFSSAPD